MKTSRRAEARPAMAPGAITVQEQVLVSVADIAGAAEEGLLALAVGTGPQVMAGVSGHRPRATAGRAGRSCRCARSRRSGRGCATGRGPSLRPGVAAVLFQVKLALEGVVDRFEPVTWAAGTASATPIIT